MSISNSPEIDGSGLSECGPVRPTNQDAIRLPDGLLASEAGLLYALADGMGGYAHGELASQLALDTLYQTFPAGARAGPAGRRLRRSIEAANLSVCQAGQRLGAVRMGTTLTALYLRADRLTVAHVGDCRAYLIRGGQSRCLTNDHTLVGDLVRMKVITPEKLRGHAQRSVLNKALGLELFVQPDIVEMALRADDRLVLCSDGVWSVIEDHEFARLAGSAAGARQVCEDLINLALERGTDDNCSAIAVHIRRLVAETAAGRVPGRSERGPGWLSTLRSHLHGGAAQRS